MPKKKVKAKNPVGRPTKYDPSKFHIIEELMSEGASKTEVAVALQINLDTLYEWCKEYSEFSETIKRGEGLSQAWWEKHGRKNLDNKDFNSTLWYMNMKNRFKWSDKIESTQNVTVKQEDAIKVLQ